MAAEARSNLCAQGRYSKQPLSTCVEIPLAPADLEHAVAAAAAEVARLAGERHALATAGTHPVSLLHLAGHPRRPLDLTHHRPSCRAGGDDLEILARQQHRPPLHVDDRLERGDTHHAIPRTAAQRTTVVSLESGPVLLRGGHGGAVIA